MRFSLWYITHCDCRHRAEVKFWPTIILLICLLMLSAAIPPWGAAGYMEGMLVVIKSAICCRASRLVGVFPLFS